jgi:hypothetical protein
MERCLQRFRYASTMNQPGSGVPKHRLGHLFWRNARRNISDQRAPVH